jgi:hypothetical protein
MSNDNTTATLGDVLFYGGLTLLFGLGVVLISYDIGYARGKERVDDGSDLRKLRRIRG